MSINESDVNRGIAKMLSAIDRLSITWKSDLSDETKWTFFPNSCYAHTAIWMHHLDAHKTHQQKATLELKKIPILFRTNLSLPTSLYLSPHQFITEITVGPLDGI